MNYLMSCTNLRLLFACTSVYDMWNSLLQGGAEANAMLGEERETLHQTGLL